MVNQQLLHKVGRQPEEGRLVIGRSLGPGRAQCFDLDQFEIQLMNHGSRLQRMIRPFRPHARRGDSPQFGVKQFHQPAGGLMVALAKPGHQPGYGIGL